MTGDERGVPHYVSRVYTRTLQDVLRTVEPLTEEQFHRRPANTNSIAFNVWHLARWADHLASILSEMSPSLRQRLGAMPEIWTAEGLQARWQFPADLGQAATGMELDADAAAALPMPAKDVLLDYAKRAFAQAGRAVASLRDDDLLVDARIDPARVPWIEPTESYGPPLSWVLVYARHDNRHLGMIEAIKGASATS
jgi:hypothetical protein